MTEHDTALRFDQALDGAAPHDLNGAESLIQTARTVQILFDRQYEIPSEAFVMQLEQQLFSPVVVPSGIEGPPAPAPHRTDLPRPARIAPDLHRISHSRLVAIAAVLVLLLGGMGAIIGGPLDPRSDPEPSAIPAASFGTAEASPEAVGEIWTVEPMPSTDGSDRPPVISNGVAFRTFFGSSSLVQAVDMQTGEVQWEGPVRVAIDVMAGAGDLLLVAGSNGARYELVAIDGRSGVERWSKDLGQGPAGLLVDGNRISVLGRDNVLEAFDLETQERLWQVGLSRFVDSGSEHGINMFSGFTGDRVAMVQGVVAVLLSNGRLVALDAASGELQWSDARRTSGWTRLAVVDGKFIVTAFGSETLSGNPDVTPIPMPPADPCSMTITIREDETAAPPSAYGETVDAFDPGTGASVWGLRADEAYMAWPLDEYRLVAQVWPGISGVFEGGDRVFNCLIDGATGTVSETTGAEFATFAYGDGQADEPWGMRVLPSGVPFGTGHLDPDVAKSLPYFEVDPETFSGFRWVQEADGLILITAQDGTLIGLPLVGPGRSPAHRSTPQPESVVYAEVAWTAVGLDEPSWWLSGHAIDDERLYLAYETGKPDPGIVRALDLETGTELWSVVLDVTSRVMTVSDELLLFGGLVLPTGQTEAVVALHAETGQEVWRAEISGRVASMIVIGDRLLVLTQSNMLNAITLESGQSISITNVGGRSKPAGSPISLGDRRLAVIDDMLVAVLADGSLAGIDLDSGEGKWWALRDTPGQTEIVVVDGVLIVFARGEPRIPEYGTPEPATPVASPIAMASPVIALCSHAVQLALPSATIDGSELQPGETMITRLDPATGVTIWNAKSDHVYNLEFKSDAGILSVVIGRDAWPADRSDMALCATDPERGRVNAVERLADVVQQPYRLGSTSPTDGQVYDIVGGTDGANGWISLPAEFDPSVPGPTIVVDEMFVEGTEMFLVHENAFYIALEGGSVSKVVFSGDA